jgi:hypothetical protein
VDDFRLDFFCVGAAKAGTTWLAACLDEHPQVCIPKSKDLAYFSAKQVRPNVPVNRGKGERWLRAQYSHCTPGQIRGDMSVGYLVDPLSPIFIKEHSPNAKIVISYRNPVEGLYSYYYQIAKEFTVPDTFEDFLEEQGYFIPMGFYYTHTMRYLQCFPPEKMHFILYEDICEDPSNVLADLFSFLSVDASVVPGSLERKVNVRKVPRSVLLRDSISNARDWLNSSPRRLRVKRVLSSLGFERMANWLYAVNLGISITPPMTKDTRARLLSIYAEENTLLGELLGRDLSHWNE